MFNQNHQHKQEGEACFKSLKTYSHPSQEVRFTWNMMILKTI